MLIDPAGRALPCHAAGVIPGLAFDNARERSLAWIWRESSAFQPSTRLNPSRPPLLEGEQKRNTASPCRLLLVLVGSIPQISPHQNPQAWTVTLRVTPTPAFLAWIVMPDNESPVMKRSSPATSDRFDACTPGNAAGFARITPALGVITPPVEKLRQQFGLPGMSLLQFAFGNDPQGPSFRPHNYNRDLVAYTGGHDNDTTVGWWSSSGASDSTRTPEDVRKEREFARAYLNLRGDDEIHWVMIRAILSSVADVAVVPLQDVLGLGSEARMNLPGTTTGNWKWRYPRDVLTDALAARLRSLTSVYDR